jgi:hypothetical protein
MAEHDNKSDGRKSGTNREKGRMSRGEAIMTLGALASSVPFLPGGILTDLSNSTPENKKVMEKILKDPILAKAISELEYLTQTDKFIVQRRGKPVLSEIPDENLTAIGLTRETWKMEILADPESNSELVNPLTVQNGNAIRWDELMKLGAKHAVSFLHVLACTNYPKPYGMGLWEGVPLRHVFWKTGPKQNIRRIFFYGYHNDDPKQIFQGSLPISRVLEDAPGELPVLLCYKLNGKWISQANGGPVRLIVPGLYANRSIKWLERIMVSNTYHANDTYAEGNNDVESPIKTYASFIRKPDKVKGGQPFAITGLAQVGMSGLKKVQYCFHPAGQPLPEEDPYFTLGAWQDAIVLPPPRNWGSDLPDGKLPPVLQIDPRTGHPFSWPITFTIAHWAALTKVDAPGEYDLRCRAIDNNGIAQPLPRPFGRSGMNRIEVARITIEA